MNGPGIMPPQPSDGTRTGMRVLFVLLAVLSCGFLGWVPLLRVALLRRNMADWVICAASGVLTLTLLVLIGREPGDTAGPRSDAAVSVLLIQAVVSAVYFVVIDIRHYRELDARMSPPPYGRQPFPYPAPQQTQLPTPRADYNPYRDTPTPTPTPAVPDPTATPTPTPGPAVTPAPRIDQVRAELDELSDYLRKEEGR